MARKIRAIAMMLRASGITIQHKTITSTRVNAKVTTASTTQKIKAIIENVKKNVIHEKVVRVDGDIIITTDKIININDFVVVDDIEYSIKPFSDHTNVTDFYKYIGVKNART